MKQVKCICWSKGLSFKNLLWKFLNNESYKMK